MPRHKIELGDLVEHAETGFVGLVCGWWGATTDNIKIYFRVWWLDGSRGYRESLVSPEDKRIKTLSGKRKKRHVVRFK
jgi:hypothetical protein